MSSDKQMITLRKSFPEIPSPALERASVDEVQDALMWAILDGAFETEEAVRHALSEFRWRVRNDPAMPSVLIPD
jgi:hypothetical protein